MDLKTLVGKARELEENRKHRFTSFASEHPSFPSPRKDRSTGIFYLACVDCQRQLYSINDKIMGTAVDGGHCIGG